MKNNIIPIERLSIRHIKAIASISGAKVLSDTHIHENDNHIFSNAIGEISGIHMVDLFSERYLLVKGYYLEYWILILNRFGKRIFFRLLDSYFEKIWEKNIL